MYNHAIVEKLTVLITVLPILMALITGLTRGLIVPWLIALFSTAFFFILTAVLFCSIKTEIIFYNVGGWDAPYGIQLRFDPLSFIMLLLVHIVMFTAIMHSKETLRDEINTKHWNLFYCVLLIFSAGMSGIIVSNDLFNIYVFLEITALATYALIACNKQKNALIAAFDYLIMGTIGSTLYLLGLGFLYAKTGTLNVTDMAQSIVYTGKVGTAMVGIVLMIVGISIKSAVFPMHNWIVNAYTFAPSSFAAALSGIGTKINLYIMLRILYQVFDLKQLLSTIHVGEILIITSFAGTVVCSICAIYKQNIRSILANSSIAQIAYITMCMAIDADLALVAAILHIINHALAKTTLFMIASNMEKKLWLTPARQNATSKKPCSKNRCYYFYYCLCLCSWHTTYRRFFE